MVKKFSLGGHPNTAPLNLSKLEAGAVSAEHTIATNQASVNSQIDTAK